MEINKTKLRYSIAQGAIGYLVSGSYDDFCEALEENFPEHDINKIFNKYIDAVEQLADKAIDILAEHALEVE